MKLIANYSRGTCLCLIALSQQLKPVVVTSLLRFDTPILNRAVTSLRNKAPLQP